MSRFTTIYKTNLTSEPVKGVQSIQNVGRNNRTSSENNNETQYLHYNCSLHKAIYFSLKTKNVLHPCSNLAADSNLLLYFLKNTLNF